jgi:hypothetical protein
MKRLIFSIGLLFTLILSKAQSHYDNFDGNNHGPLIYLNDTINKSSIWQIGQPQKNTFTKAFSLPNSLVTDTINPYPINDTSIIVFKVPVWSHDWGAHTITFQYQLNTDSLNDFGKLEVSGDGGVSFINVLDKWNEYGFWWNGEIIQNFTGNTYEWKRFSICVSGLLNSFPSADTIQYRFSFTSDGIQTGKDGWIIDNIEVIDVTESTNEIDNNNFCTCYPNPTSNIIIIEYKTFKGDRFSLGMFNYKGQLIWRKSFQEDKVNINVCSYENGTYFYQIIDTKNNFQTYNKFIINK